jgi:hypothetical protein
MNKLARVGFSVAAVLVVGVVVTYSLHKKKVIRFSVPTSCPAVAVAKCPTKNDVDANGCPNGGYNAGTGECVVPFKYYTEYGGCADPHDGMIFYSQAGGTPNKYHVVAGFFLDPIQVAFTEIDCNTHAPVGPINAGQPFAANPSDDFSIFQPDHVSGVADPNMNNKCFKVTVNPFWDDCIDPHVIIKGN